MVIQLPLIRVQPKPFLVAGIGQERGTRIDVVAETGSSRAAESRATIP
jgi:hypothetical protein